MADIFISYNREDQARAGAFAQAFEAAGLSVWWDVGLRTGEAYDEVTESALRAARAVVVLWSKKSVASRWVRAEATLAHRNKTLFPCMIEACDRPIMFELTQTAELTHWTGDQTDPSWRMFVTDLKRFIAGEAAEPSASTGHSRAAAAPVARASLVASVLSRRGLIIAGGAVAAAGALAGSLVLFRGGRALAANGVAVLPFRNLSGDPKQDYLSIGVSSEVRAVLARNSALRVVAQASCEMIKKRALGAAEMARELAVSFLLDGNVTRSGDRLRVAAELIDGRTGFSKWSHTFDNPMDELPTVQDAIAEAVTIELAVAQPGGSATEDYGGTDNAAAFNDYLKGNELYAAATDLESDLRALANFDHAIERDPKFGAAHAARARSLTSLGNTADNVARARLYYESARAAAERAVEAGPGSADAHSTLGFVLFQALLRVADARAPYEHSYELGGGDAAVVGRFATYCAATRRRAEAARAIARARELDPLNATIHRAVGFVHYAAGDYEAANEAVGRALALNPALSDSHARIGMAMVAMKRPEEAIAAAADEKNGMVRYPCVAIAQHMLGKLEAADAALADLVNAYGDAGLYQQAQILSRWGREDEAMAILEKAMELGDSGLTYAYIDPTLDPLRGRDDFKRLLEALGFV